MGDLTTNELVAEPVVENIGDGEEGTPESDCKHCGGAVFLDTNDRDYETGEPTIDDSTFWQHNDERYTPGALSPCGPPDKWEALRP